MTETDTATESDHDAQREERDAARRRTIIRLLVGLGIGIPVMVELATFVGLIESALLGGDSDGDGGGSGTTATAEETGVGVGEELLPATPQTETLTDASYRAASEQWVLTLVARVENTTTEPYTFQFGDVVTDGGRRVEGAGRAVRVEVDATAQATGTWQLPPGSRPARVEVRAASGDAATTTTAVRLANIPVEGN